MMTDIQDNRWGLYGNNIIKEMERANFFEEKFGNIKDYIILYPYMDYCPSDGGSYLAAEGGGDEWAALGTDSIFCLKKS